MDDTKETESVKRAKPKGPHFVYVLRGIKHKKIKYYIGYTNNVDKRLRQHNREITGGAKATVGFKWKILCSLTGFKCYEEALACEWRLKHPSGKRGWHLFKFSSLETVLKLSQWTKKHTGLDEALKDGRLYTFSACEELLASINVDTLHKCITINKF